MIVCVIFALPQTKMNQIWPITVTLSTALAGIFIIHMELFSLCVLKVKRVRRREEYKYEAKAKIQVTCHIKPQMASFPL